MLDDIYNNRILEFAAHIDRLGRLEQPDASAKKHSKLCGSTITVDIKVQNGAISDFAQDVHACALGQASASMMARHIIGLRTDELYALRNQIYEMLTNNGEPPTGKFADFAVLQPIKDYKARHASTMLVFDAIVECLEQLEK